MTDPVIDNLVKEITRARDVIMGMNKMFPTISEGRDAVAVGEYFTVPGTGNIFSTLYRKTGATTQEVQGEFPSRLAYESLGSAAQKNMATLEQALAGATGVLPDAEQVKALLARYGVGVYPSALTSDGANDIGVGMMFSTSSDGSFSDYSSCIHLPYYSPNYGSQIAMVNGSGRVIIRARTKSNGTWGSPVELLHSSNTTIDSNGFVKQASPIINLFNDQIEANGFESLADAVLEKTETGVYVISGVPELATEGWYIETPRDRNGNIYFTMDYEQDLEAGTLIVRTYEPDYSTGPATNGAAADIVDGRFIVLRFSESEKEGVDGLDGEGAIPSE